MLRSLRQTQFVDLDLNQKGAIQALGEIIKNNPSPFFVLLEELLYYLKPKQEYTWIDDKWFDQWKHPKVLERTNYIELDQRYCNPPKHFKREEIIDETIDIVLGWEVKSANFEVFKRLSKNPNGFDSQAVAFFSSNHRSGFERTNRIFSCRIPHRINARSANDCHIGSGIHNESPAKIGPTGLSGSTSPVKRISTD